MQNGSNFCFGPSVRYRVRRTEVCALKVRKQLSNQGKITDFAILLRKIWLGFWGQKLSQSSPIGDFGTSLRRTGSRSRAALCAATRSALTRVLLRKTLRASCTRRHCASLERLARAEIDGTISAQTALRQNRALGSACSRSPRTRFALSASRTARFARYLAHKQSARFA